MKKKKLTKDTILDEFRKGAKQAFDDLRCNFKYLQSVGDIQVGGDHYKCMVIQPAEFCTKNDIGYLEGAVIKYVCRYKKKNGKQDLEKAIHCIQLLIEYNYKNL